jgi:hypothetical protein
MDLNKFFNDVSRIADALEDLASAKKAGKVEMPSIKIINTPRDADPGFGKDDPPAAISNYAPLKSSVPSSDPDDKLRREFLKSELRRINVPHAAAARTRTLEAMYFEALTNPPVVYSEALKNPPVVQKSEPEVVIPPTPPAPPVPPSDPDPIEKPSATIEQARAALVAYVAKVGKEKAVALLVEIGGASQLSKCDPAKYAEIVRSCREALR